jgi:uncharacterized membrane protein
LISRRLASISYLCLLALQVAWHALLPPPAGAGSWLLAAVAALPLLLPLRGVLRGSLRAITWAGYLAMLYLVVGVMEAWANPPQRAAALAQVALVAVFVGSALAYSRHPQPRS